jgi:hypothetical protein
MKPKMTQIHAFKEKEKEGGDERPQLEFQCLVALKRFQCLVANGRFQVWWPLKGSKLGGLWKEK